MFCVLFRYTGDNEKTAVFDFLINGELLRSTLEFYLEDKEISIVR